MPRTFLWTTRFRNFKVAIGTFLLKKFLVRLFKSMQLAFRMAAHPIFSKRGPLKDYARNITGFEGRYVFGSSASITISAILSQGTMRIVMGPIDSWDAKVTFRNDWAFLRFLLFGHIDILLPMLRNEVVVEGNFNYLAKFGFMSRDLLHRLGVKI